MRRASRNLLGLFGVALVVAVTAFAVQIPTSPGAAAASEEINIAFTITPSESAEPSVEVTNPENHARVVSRNVNIAVSHQDAYFVTVELVSPSGATSIIFSDSPVNPTGTLSIPTVLTEFGRYTVNAYIDGIDAGSYATTSDFTFASIKASITDNGNQEQSTTLVGNSIVCVEVDHNVADSFLLQLVNSKGEVVFSKRVDVSGIPKDKVPGCVYVDLPIATDNIANGEYDIVVTAYDDSDNAIGDPYVLPVIVDIVLPPKTGILAFADSLTSDYAAMAILIFVSLVLFILFIIKRHKNNAERR